MKFIKEIIAITVAAAAFFSNVSYTSAQDRLFPGTKNPAMEVTDSLQAPEGYIYADSTIIRFADKVDSTLAGKIIFDLMPSKTKGDNADVKVHQSSFIRTGMMNHINSNQTRTIEGYRVRIFFDNKQSSRVASENMVKEFRKQYPEIPAYRNHVNPYFKVTVGDFRTRSEAMLLLKRIAGEFPTAFVVREIINYPAIDKEHPIVSDTVRVLRPIEGYGDVRQTTSINL